MRIYGSCTKVRVGQKCLHSMDALGGEDFLDMLERVDFRDGFIGTKADDSREAEGEAAFVTIGVLNIIEGNFKDDGGFDLATESLVFHGVSEEIFGEMANFGVGDTGIRFADVGEAVAGAHGKGVIGEQAAALAVPVFGSGDDDVEGGQWALELEPKLAAASRNIRRLRSLGD